MFAWLYIAQAALGLLFATLALLTVSAFGIPTGAEIGGLLGTLGPGAGPATELSARVGELTRLSLLINLLTLAGAIGILVRRRWGWFMMIGVQLLGALLAFIWVLPMIRQLYELVDPNRAGPSSLLTVALLTLIPVSVISFLMLDGVVRQFRRDVDSMARRTSGG